ncbi:MAG: D-alanyl-D-alanine carboxypeptidase [Rhodobacteraceae bacterium]|jgi:D-alanyl-D-alanine carboxypeptidase|nr:D-alanyl-D-alanine carboxypeptidase [Paracoccaceae bacterium]MBL4556695.1 D-alanyl-D-alanine carboxypeptidase [Paracoccaceae bacterium]HBG98782.1 D-alanyl-D-alanine carboxypeptidase [Paracoccaceae bacterium]
MRHELVRTLRAGLFALVALCLAAAVQAAPYAAMVMDARTGEVLHSRNADTRLHPASLTKMMTLYVVFEAVERGEIGLDTPVRISRNAAAEPPSKLGLREGQTIALRYLIRAAAVKSANDAATAMAEAVGGSEAAFIERMNRMAAAMGMDRTTFRNAHGLTQEGHLSTARDMTILGRHLLYDFPEYYNLFSRRETSAQIATVRNTNRRLLNAYRGADGIKTGYTRAAGFNLVASAERGQERIIATMFGGSSAAARNARVAELLDMGFQRAPSRATVQAPHRQAVGLERLAMARSPRPPARPQQVILAALRHNGPTEAATETLVAAVAGGPADGASLAAVAVAVAPRPAERNPMIDIYAQTPEIVTRASRSGERLWAIDLGQEPSRYAAERVLLTTALREPNTLDGALRKVVTQPGGFSAQFVGLTEEQAQAACARIAARNRDCTPLAPPS